MINLILLAVGILFAPQTSWSWGDLGHRAVGKIAEGHLTPKTRKALEALMGKESLAHASTYADEIRSDESKKVVDGKEVSYWHFVEIPDGKTYEESEKNPNGNAIEAFLKMKARLEDPKASKESKLEAVRWIVHLVGDIHQPLHVGNGKDRGANLCFIQWKGRDANLHSIIDEQVFDGLNLSYTELAEFIVEVNREKPEILSKGDIYAWANESKQQRDALYPIAEGDNPRPYCKSEGEKKRVDAYDLGHHGHFAYTYKVRPLLEKRILQAGLRLAKVLNETLGK